MDGPKVGVAVVAVGDATVDGNIVGIVVGVAVTGNEEGALDGRNVGYAEGIADGEAVG